MMSPSSSGRLLGLMLGCAILIPVSAAELEGTPVPVGDPPPVNVQVDIDPAPALPQGQEMRAREAEVQAHEAEQQARDHHNWQQDLEKNLQQAFGGKHQYESDNGSATAMEALIVIISVIAGVTFLCSPFILIGFYLSLRYRVRTRRQQDINSNIDKLLAAGRDIPVELLRGDDPKSASESGDLSRGIRNLFMGLGLLIFLSVFLGFKLGSVGFIWIAFGCSQILIWYLNKPTAGSAEQQVGQQD